SFASGVDDFDRTLNRNGFEFVYHDSHDLMLVIHGDKCYFGKIEDSTEEEKLLSNPFFRSEVE
ncbi:hypothetical protein BaRGS_00017352, partial [Batillaria attramentaria]